MDTMCSLHISFLEWNICKSNLWNIRNKHFILCCSFRLLSITTTKSWMFEETGHTTSLSGSRKYRMLVLSCLSPVYAGQESRQRLLMSTFRVGLFTSMNLSGNFFQKISKDFFFSKWCAQPPQTSKLYENEALVVLYLLNINYLVRKETMW